MHKHALKAEDYTKCHAIQEEINKRIENGTINTSLMDGFRKFDPETQEFHGEPNYNGLNGLFKNYR